VKPGCAIPKPRNILDRRLKVVFKVKVHRVTKGARSKIEAAGGSVELIET
jgi:ribosomal protein L15